MLMKQRRGIVVYVCLLMVCIVGSRRLVAQQANEQAGISNASLDVIEKKYKGLEASLQKQTEKLLQRMQRKEAKLHKAMSAKDSTANALFAGSAARYKALEAKLKSGESIKDKFPLKEYIPGLDSVHSATRFLEQAKDKLPAGQLEKVQALNDQLKSFESKLQQANDIKAFIKERQQQLKAEVEKLNLTKQFTSLNKEAYYYSQRLQEYKALINDRKKLEEKALATLRELPAFKNFLQKNSYLAQLFGTPSDLGSPAALAGLQTRAQVGSIISQRMGMGGAATDNHNVPQADPSSMMQQQIQAAQAQLNQLKDKVNQLGGGGSSDLDMPAFKPNQQKTKSFWQRLEYGANLQTAGTSGLLPATMDIGLSLGYKLNDKSVIGIGGSYKLGLGKPVSHMELSNQGIGIRSFLDVKLKGSIWITGGYEYNYLQAFKDLSTIRNLDVWQKSGLIGLTKKFKAGKKDGKLQLLWDFLSYSQVPRGQAIKFRIGYNF